ncbi:ankyrin repeat-containing protein At5g02620 [Lactuca sativa]|uniref:PGG domain-containing protein n=1 Tax=Lactuca sativa TaxID=4236 RepID=A0A9R1VIL7_LACSA|nr:ankyrin repeat-containing protein At5g02620 [Lactuca sativa]KAJ0207937.1 hypothetical protein LSAT_V11C500239430 [Lactuca sativa]
MNPNLFDASLTGNVQLLNALLQEDELVLDRIPLSCFSETPLHIAALRGHLDFVKILVRKKPKLAMSLDSQRRTALHLASTEGHVEIVCELLNVMSPEGWRFHDQEGRTALQLAVMNEQLEIIKLLIQKDVGKELQRNGETILHTCISWNRFEAMKLLSELWNDEELAKLTDCNDNTLLHLAVVHKQIQTVTYLLQKPSVRAAGTIVNGHGFTALDILDHCPQDLGALQIRSLLMEANFLRAKDVSYSLRPFQSSTESKSSEAVANPESKHKLGCMSRVWKWYLNHNGDWLEKQRGILILAAILVAGTSFYSGLHPPGGTFINSNDGPLGNAVQTEVVMGNSTTFVIHNTIIMVVSMMIALVFLCGISLRNKFCLWVLNLASACILFYTTLTYLQEIAWMSPDSWVNAPTAYMCFAWILLCFLFAFIHTVFFGIWAIKKLLNARARKRNNI